MSLNFYIPKKLTIKIIFAVKIAYFDIEEQLPLSLLLHSLSLKHKNSALKYM